LLLCSLFSLVAACGSDTGETPAADGGNNPGADADPAAPDANPNQGDFTTLIEGTWSKAPGSDAYHCTWLTVQEDIYITGFEAIAPAGTHHTVLSVTNDYTGPDKEEACGVGDIADQILFGSGVGTAAYALPSGVAMKVSAGQTLMLNLHLFNIGDTTIEGTSGTRVTTTTADAVENLAEFVFAGTAAFFVPANSSDYTQTGYCTMPTDGKIFALWPHMHQVGKHMKISHKGTTVLDTPYDFNEQKMYPVEPFDVQAGDRIDVTCTWNNTTGTAKTFGDKSTDEMCFGGIYRYPASGQNAGICLNQ
jgi:hypothetical protein